MNPLLKSGDMLEFLPYTGRKMNRGDIVVFQSPEYQKKTLVVHRIQSIHADRIRTKGDHNNHPDQYFLATDDIIGQVVALHRGPVRRAVLGGWRGHVQGFILGQLFQPNSWLYQFLSWNYHRLADSGIVSRWLPFRFKTRVLSIHKQKGTEWQLLLGQRVIGRYQMGQNSWYIKPPFRLIIDEASLSSQIQDCDLPEKRF